MSTANKKKNNTNNKNNSTNNNSNNKSSNNNNNPAQPEYHPPQPSILAEYVLYPIYDGVVRLYPRWWTPNGITLAGIGCTLLASLLLLAAMPPTYPTETEYARSDYHYYYYSENNNEHSKTRDDRVRALGDEFLHSIINNNNKDSNSHILGAPQQTSLELGEWFGATRHRALTNLNKNNNKNNLCLPQVPRLVGLYGRNTSCSPYSISLSLQQLTTAVINNDNNNNKDKRHVIRPILMHQALSYPTTRTTVAVLYLWHHARHYSRKLLSTLVTDPVLVDTICNTVHAYIVCPAVTVLRYARKGYYVVSDAILGTREHTTRPTSSTPTPSSSSSSSLLQLFLPSDLLASPGRILMLIAGVLNFIYCFADNTDGRHARRTKQMSFVGEYLDHGLDCVTSLLSTFLLGCALGGEPYYIGVAVAVIATATLFCHTLHQERGIMIWGNRLITVDEAMLGFAFGFMVIALVPHLFTVLIPVDDITSLLFGVNVSAGEGATSTPTAQLLQRYLPTALYETRVMELAWIFFVLAQVQIALSMVWLDYTLPLRLASVSMYMNTLLFIVLVNIVGQPNLLSSSSSAIRSVTTSRTAIALNDKCVNNNNNKPLLGAVLLDEATRLDPTTLHGTVLLSLQHYATVLVAALPATLLLLLQVIETSVSIVFCYEAQWALALAMSCSIIIHCPITAKCLKQPRSIDATPIIVSLPLIWFIFFFMSSAVGTVVAVMAHAIQIIINVARIQYRGMCHKKRQLENKKQQ